VDYITTLWIVSFALYILIYAPMLWKPDIDELVPN